MGSQAENSPPSFFAGITRECTSVLLSGKLQAHFVDMWFDWWLVSEGNAIQNEAMWND